MVVLCQSNGQMWKGEEWRRKVTTKKPERPMIVLDVNGLLVHRVKKKKVGVELWDELLRAVRDSNLIRISSNEEVMLNKLNSLNKTESKNEANKMSPNPRSEGSTHKKCKKKKEDSHEILLLCAYQIK